MCSFFICILLWSMAGRAFGDLAHETLYLTWQRDPTTTMTIQWLTPQQETMSEIVYHPSQASEDVHKAAGVVFPFPTAPQYLIHRVELTNLQPDTEYIFSLPPESSEYRFLTAPAHLTGDLRFVVGGDMYHDAISFMIKTSKQAAATSPLFALVGGDIAYAVSSRYYSVQKIDRWIEWIQAWHSAMVTPEKRLVPVIAALGNHDLIGEFGQTSLQAQVYSALFPMPGPQIYNALDFDHYLSLFILDSGHANPIAGAQTEWLARTLEERATVTHRFAIYHVPAYPSVRGAKDPNSTAIRTHWVPLFEKWRLHAAFENHDHTYKRTYPMLGGSPHPQGIIYFGDGAWGIEKPRVAKKRPSYIDKFASLRHFILVTLTPTGEEFKSIGDDGQLIDQYKQFFKKEEGPAQVPLAA